MEPECFVVNYHMSTLEGLCELTGYSDIPNDVLHDIQSDLFVVKLGLQPIPGLGP